MDAIYGFVLAGGESKRMGTNKALLELGGVPLFERAASLLDEFCARVSIVGDLSKVSTARAVIPDELSDRRGSIVGLATALRASETEFTAVLSCDMPFVSTEALEALVTAATGDAGHDAFMFEIDGRLQPLFAIYRTAAARNLVYERFESGNWRLRELAAALNTRVLNPADLMTEGARKKAFMNINTPDDFQAALAAYALEQDQTLLRQSA